MGELKNRVRYFRFMNSEMTQEQLASMVGVTRQTIHAIETDKFSPSAKLAFRIARAFGVSVDQVFWLEGGEPSEHD